MITGKEGSQKQDSADGTESASIEELSDEEAEHEQYLYATLIELLNRSGTDVVDGKIEHEKPFDVEHAVYLLCNATPESLATHLAITVDAAFDFQLDLNLHLDKIQTERDEKLLKLLNERGSCKNQSSDFCSESIPVK